MHLEICRQSTRLLHRYISTLQCFPCIICDSNLYGYINWSHAHMDEIRSSLWLQ